MKYRNKQTGKEIEVVDAYSDLLIYVEGTEAKQTHSSQWEPVAPLPPNSRVISAQAESSQPQSQSPSPVPSSSSGELFYINDATSPEIAKEIDGLGKAYAKKVFDNKPDGGYQDWNHIATINRELPVAWDGIAQANQHVSFDMPSP